MILCNSLLNLNNHVINVSGLPQELKESSGKWKDILLTQFPSQKRLLDDSSTGESMDLSSFVDGLLNAHVTVFVTGNWRKLQFASCEHSMLERIVDQGIILLAMLS